MEISLANLEIIDLLSSTSMFQEETRKSLVSTLLQDLEVSDHSNEALRALLLQRSSFQKDDESFCDVVEVVK